MNINAGTNEYNIRLQKIKEEKRPTFATIFDKLDARSKKLTPKNALNAVLTNDQMFRYYLEEVEPQLAGDVDNLDDLQNAIGNNSLGEIKLRDFAKLLSGDLESTKATPIYETLTAGVSYSPMVAPLITPPSISAPPATPASAPSGSGTASAPPATPASAPSGSGTASAPPATPASAPSGSGTASAPPATPASAPSGSGTASAPPATPAPAPATPASAPPATPATPASAPASAPSAPAGGLPVPVADGGGYIIPIVKTSYDDAVKSGKTPPRFPNDNDKSKPDHIGSFTQANIEWIKYFNEVVIYNNSVPTQYKLSYNQFSNVQLRIIIALDKQKSPDAVKLVKAQYDKDKRYFMTEPFNPSKNTLP